MPAAKPDKTPKDKARDLKSEIEKSAKLFDDVAKPGNTPAQPTSRPVIVGHPAMIKDDPMMKGKSDDSQQAAGEEVPAKTHRAKSISPLDEKNSETAETTQADEGETEDKPAEEDSDSDKITVSVVSSKKKAEGPETIESSEPESQPEEPAAEPLLEDKPGESATEQESAPPEPTQESEEVSADEVAKEQPEPEKIEPENAEPATEEPTEEPSAEPDAEQEDNAPGQGVVDSLVEEANAKKDNQKKDDELVARAEEAEKLIASKQYFVPIGQVSRRRSNHRIFFGLVILFALAAAAVNFAVDAEVIDIGVNAFTDLL